MAIQTKAIWSVLTFELVDKILNMFKCGYSNESIEPAFPVVLFVSQLNFPQLNISKFFQTLTYHSLLYVESKITCTATELTPNLAATA